MDDSEVAAAIAAGDPAGLAAAYDRYAAPLYGYCRWMLPESGQAADALLGTFITAHATLGELRDARQMRAWLYATARDECLSRTRAPGAGFDELAGEAGQPADARRAELRRLIRATLAQFDPLEHEVIELTIRHNLDAAELATVLEVSWNRAHALASRAREHLEEALVALLMARTGRQACPELGALLARWDGRLTVETGKLAARHIAQCETCTRRRPGALRPEALTDLLPLAALPGELRRPILQRATARAEVAAYPDAPSADSALRPGGESYPEVQGRPEDESSPEVAVRPEAQSSPDAAVRPEAQSSPDAAVRPEAESFLDPMLRPSAEPQPGAEPGRGAAAGGAPGLAGFRQAGALLRWSRIRANPGPATAAAAVAMWVIAATSATLITITGAHADHALAAQTRPATPTASTAAGRGTSADAESSRARSQDRAHKPKPAGLASPIAPSSYASASASPVKPAEPTLSGSVTPSASKSPSSSPSASASPSRSPSPKPTPTPTHTPSPTPSPNPAAG